MLLFLLLRSRCPQAERGFTLLELLITIVMMGILSAIALPSFLNQKVKAQETEGKTLVGSMNRAQQAHYAVYEAFAQSLADLELGIPGQGRFYDYDVASSADGKLVTNKARSRNPELRGYAGVVAKSEDKTTSLLCRSQAKGSVEVAEGKAIGTLLQCPEDYQAMN